MVFRLWFTTGEWATSLISGVYLRQSKYLMSNFETSISRDYTEVQSASALIVHPL